MCLKEICSAAAGTTHDKQTAADNLPQILVFWLQKKLHQLLVSLMGENSWITPVKSEILHHDYDMVEVFSAI